ncbi:MAG: VOC family protein [bacterium]
MIKRVDAIIYNVTDLAAAKKFYGEALGLELKVDEQNFAAFDAGNMLIGLRAMREGNSHPREPEVVFYTHDLNLAFEHLLERRVHIPAPPIETDWGARKINFRDLDGHPLEIVTYTKVRL